MRYSLCSSLLLVALLSACSTPDSRIDSNRAAFDQYPVAVQEKIRAGRVDVGFTPAMVRLALGEPNRTFTRKTETGEAEVWIYTDNKPAISFGIGYASGGSRSATGIGVGTSTGGREADEKARVEFRDGLVFAVESSK